MSIIQRFKNGLYTASKSFNLVMNNKKLLLYLGVPILAGSLIEILAYNTSMGRLSLGMSFSPKETIVRLLKGTATQNWFLFISILGIYFLYLAIVTFQSIALTHHTTILSKGANIGLFKNIKACTPKLKKSLVWSTFVLIPIITFYMLKTYMYTLDKGILQSSYLFIIFFLFVSWSLITSYVIQVTTIEEVSILQAIKISFYAIKKTLFEYLGNMFWLCLIAFLSIIPFIILEQYIKTVYYLPAILLLSCFISTTYTISKTLLYQHFKKQEIKNK